MSKIFLINFDCILGGNWYLDVICSINFLIITKQNELQKCYISLLVVAQNDLPTKRAPSADSHKGETE